MVRAHKQAWVWQDEWFGLTMDDIREIERETQRILEQKMKKPRGSLSEESGRRKAKRRSSSVKDAGKHRSFVRFSYEIKPIQRI